MLKATTVVATMALQDDWEEMIPFAQGILRASKMPELGGRSPYEVVTGIKPKLPVAMVTEGPREFVPVD